MPRELDFIEGNNGPLRRLGEEGVVSGGVFDPSPYEEDGPVTWEALASPRRSFRSCGEPVTRLRRPARWQDARVVGLLRHRTSVRHGVGDHKGNRSGGRWGQGVGGLHRSDDVGERPGKLDPAEQRRPVLM